MLRKVFCVAIAALVMGTGSVHGSILLLNPGAGVLDTNRWQWQQNGNADASAVGVKVGLGPLALTTLYKSDFEGSNQAPTESGSFASSYTTQFYSGDDPNNFELNFDGGSFINFERVFLIIKGGSQNPNHIVFDISQVAPGLEFQVLGGGFARWDGKLTIRGEGFMPSGQAISHIEIFGTQPLTAIPEPGTMTIWAVGCLAAFGAGLRRRS